MTVRQRDEAALQALMDEVIAVYPQYLGPRLARSGISLNQARMTVRILIRRELHGDDEATKELDALEERLKERQANGPLPPIEPDLRKGTY
jgi:hypothetical protein